jgi:hypothetical protein
MVLLHCILNKQDSNLKSGIVSQNNLDVHLLSFSLFDGSIRRVLPLSTRKSQLQEEFHHTKKEHCYYTANYLALKV